MTISTIVTKPNLNSVGSVGEFLGDYISRGGQVHAWHIYKFLPQGRGGTSHESELTVTEAEYDHAYNQAKSLNLPVRLFMRRDMYHSKEVDFFWVENGVIRQGSEIAET